MSEQKEQKPQTFSTTPPKPIDLKEVLARKREKESAKKNSEVKKAN